MKIKINKNIQSIEINGKEITLQIQFNKNEIIIGKGIKIVLTDANRNKFGVYIHEQIYDINI